MSWRVSPKASFQTRSLTPTRQDTRQIKGEMRNVIDETINIPKNVEKNRDLIEVLKTLGETCRKCAPLTPLECISRCTLWKLKNELRALRETMDNPNFIKELLNVLKNNTRLHILKAIVSGRYSVSRLQEELKKAGYSHSQDTINEEYLRPLMQVGLAAEAQNQYYATTFGGRLSNMLEDFSELVAILPGHSHLCEETVLDTLISEPKTFEEISTFVSPKIASRILTR